MLHHKFFEMNWFNKFEDKWNGLSSTILIILGNLIYAFSINLLITPMHLYNGGFLGISQIVRYLIVANTGVRTIYGLDFTGIIYFMINIPLFLYAYSSAGFKFATKTLISIGISSVCLTLVPVPKVPYIDDYLTACVVAGVIGGIGTGMILRGGSSTGGPDIIAVCMAKKNPNVSVGMLNNVVNFAVYGCCLLLFNVKIAVYSFIYSAIKAMFIDRMHTQNIKTEVLIITKEEGIEKILTEELNRGVTSWKGTGAYTGDEVNIILTLVSKYEIEHLKGIVHDIDPHAFLMMSEGENIVGNFKRHIGVGE